SRPRSAPTRLVGGTSIDVFSRSSIASGARSTMLWNPARRATRRDGWRGPGRGSRRGGGSGHDEAGDGLEDAVDLLDLLDDQLSDRVDVGGLTHRDHVVLTGYRVGGRDAALPLDLSGDLDRPPR